MGKGDAIKNPATMLRIKIERTEKHSRLARAYVVEVVIQVNCSDSFIASSRNPPAMPKSLLLGVPAEQGQFVRSLLITCLSVVDADFCGAAAG
jgi:hypothetical protein